jgi:predicted alpha/beta superfamily hydrolase
VLPLKLFLDKEQTLRRLRSFRFSILFIIFAASAALSSNCTLRAQEQERQHTLTGDIRVHKKFHSKFLTSDRDVLVYLPPGYEADKKKRYPVFYMHDGQNLFDGATSFIPGKEWRVDETAQSLIQSGAIKPLIIVGIYNGGQDRMDEYTPVRVERFKAGGKADQYGRMLVEELKPFVDANYRTLKDAKDTALGGSSLGGLVSLYLGLKYPKTFGRLAVISPSVWWGERLIVKDVLSLQSRPQERIWLDIGTKEGRNAEEENESLADTRRLRDALIRKGWKLNKDLSYFEDEGAEHNEAAWAKRVEPILKFLFPK